jgi:hypothetical protein
MTRNINKLSWWLRVREDWREDKGGIFICNSSKVFKKVYKLGSNRRRLFQLKEQFLSKSRMKKAALFDVYTGKGSSLFCMISFSQNRRIRTEFINWNIRRLSKQKQ